MAIYNYTFTKERKKVLLHFPGRGGGKEGDEAIKEIQMYPVILKLFF